MVIHAAGVATIVHTLKQDVAGTQARRPRGPRADLVVYVNVVPRQRHPKRLATRPVGRLHLRESLDRTHWLAPNGGGSPRAS